MKTISRHEYLALLRDIFCEINIRARQVLDPVTIGRDHTSPKPREIIRSSPFRHAGVYCTFDSCKSFRYGPDRTPRACLLLYLGSVIAFRAAACSSYFACSADLAFYFDLLPSILPSAAWRMLLRPNSVLNDRALLTYFAEEAQSTAYTLPRPNC